MSSGNQTKPLAPGLMLERAKELLESGELDRAYIEALEKDTENALEHDNRCAEDGYYWLTTFVYTFDEHAVGADQIKRFPDAVQPETGARPFEILWCLLKTESQLICIKSRQILQSWLHAAEKLHTALYGGPAVRIPLQSETQELANALLERVAFMYEMLPAWMQKIHPLLSPITTTKIHLQPPHGMAGPGSKIIAIPQGGNKLRSFTNSEVFMDEGAFQPECRDAIKGCKPTISGGGRLHVVTTPNGKEVCYELFTDQPKTVRPKNRGKLITEEEPAKGMLVRRNRNGWCAVRLHYSMVPWRDPDTKEGAAWVEDEKGSTPAADWEQEYEISFEIYDGTPVYGADFKPGFHSAPKIKFREHLPVIRGWDYGYRHPYALIGQKTQAGQLLCIYELLGRDIPIQVFSDVVLWVCGQNLSVGPTKTPDFMKDVSEWRKQQDSIARSTHDERLQQVRRYVDQQHIEGINCFDDLARFNEVSYSKFVDYDDPAGSQHTQMSEFTAR
ncbi:MAG: hypothetical protein GY700_06650, partial [Propionibacteriaceae bacterium]|nr:hypothetical protein [Propionibacteriaceae bacterium]